MRAWHTVLVLNVALLVGLGGGYLHWGRKAERLTAELAIARAARRAVEREWRVDGVVRAIMPEVNVLVVTHEDIPGFMRPMTMGFRAESEKIRDAVQVGDPIRFTLRGIPPRVSITTIEKLAPSPRAPAS